MREYGGFEHNLQSLRVVDELEERYAEFRRPQPHASSAARASSSTARCATRASSASSASASSTHRQPGLEAQLANLADEIAYNNHDVDDGLRAGLIDAGELREVRCSAPVRRGRAAVPALGERRAGARDRAPHDQRGRDRPDSHQRRASSRGCAAVDIDAVRAHAAPLASP